MQFEINAPFDALTAWLARSSVGISTMVDEHFGINVVEYMVREGGNGGELHSNDDVTIGFWLDPSRSRVRWTFARYRRPLRDQEFTTDRLPCNFVVVLR